MLRQAAIFPLHLREQYAGQGTHHFATESAFMDKPASLLVIIDPTANVHPALARARQLALACGARVELFVCYLSGETRGLHLDERGLERLANGLREQGIEITTDEASAPTIYGGILRKVLRSRHSMVIKDTHPHSLLRRTIATNTDWQLIRLCPVPILFVRPGDWSHPPRFAAAVDIALPGEKPASLDRRLLSTVEMLALATRGQAHAVHVYDPVSQAIAVATSMAVPMAAGLEPATIVLAKEAQAREQFADLLRGQEVPPDNRRLLAGAPADALVEYARGSKIDVLVMGAVSRGWMYNVVVGSTTERILDLLPCDVLVVKPEGFECPVVAQPARSLSPSWSN